MIFYLSLFQDNIVKKQTISCDHRYEWQSKVSTVDYSEVPKRTFPAFTAKSFPIIKTEFPCVHISTLIAGILFSIQYLLVPCLTLYGIAVYLWHCKYIKRNDRGMTTVIRVYSFLCVTHKENYINPLWFHCHSAVCICSVHKCKDFTFTIIWAYKTISASIFWSIL